MKKRLLTGGSLAGGVFVCYLLLAATASAGAAGTSGSDPLFSSDAPTPPAQPASGPGGKAARYAEVVAKAYGSGPTGYWLFEPASPTPEKAPLVIFNHGWSAMDPRTYQAWINHIVQRGNIVVYPLYQDSLLTPLKDFTPNAIAAVKDAMHTLETEPGHVKPQLDKFALVGHSMGGPISANLAALWKAQGLPMPRALFCVEPGKTWGTPGGVNFQLANLAQIPADTLLLTLAGDADTVVRDVDAKRIFNESTHVYLTNKNYVKLISDEHGAPVLNAGHMAPLAWAMLPSGTPTAKSSAAGPLRQRLQERMAERRGGDAKAPDFNQAAVNPTLDALDYYGIWKLCDGLTDAAFYGTNRNYALGQTHEQRFMGLWSDGVPVKEMIVTDHP